jgi:hypothetical protein
MVKRKKAQRNRIKHKSPLRKNKNEECVAKPTDTRLRMLLIPKPAGVREVAIRGSQQASRLRKFWAAVRRYLQTGDDSALRRLKNKSVTDASGKRRLFLTNLKRLDRLASAGEDAGAKK